MIPVSLDLLVTPLFSLFCQLLLQCSFLPFGGAHFSFSPLQLHLLFSEIYDDSLVISSLMLNWQALIKGVMVDNIDEHWLEALMLLG